MNDGCTGIIITGTALKGPNTAYPWALGAKNSDTNDVETPVYVAAKAGYNMTYMAGPTFPADQVTIPWNTYAYVGTKIHYVAGRGPPDGPAGFYRVGWGINEKGLYGCYTQLTDVDDTAEWIAETLNANGYNHGGRELLTTILALYDAIDDHGGVDGVLTALLDSTSPIGRENRGNSDGILLVDRYGTGVIIEVSKRKAIYRYVVNGYWTEDNLSRLWIPYYSDIAEPGGVIANDDKVIAEVDAGSRTAFLTTYYHELKNAAVGPLDYRTIIKWLMRYVNHKEEGESNYLDDISGHWDISMSDLGGTQSSGVGITGCSLYNGGLNACFGAYGNPTHVGVYLLHMARAGDPPIDGAGAWSDAAPNDSMYNHVTSVKVPSVMASGYYVPASVRALQAVARICEDYQIQLLENLLKTVPAGLTDGELNTLLNDVVDDAQQTGAKVYRSGGTPYIVELRNPPSSHTGLDRAIQHHPYDTSPYHKLLPGSIIPVVSGQHAIGHYPPQPVIDMDTQCTLTVNIVGPTTGGQACSVTLNPAGGSYAPGTEVTLTPVPGSAYNFKTWGGDLSGSTTPTTIIMDGDKTISSAFEYEIGNSLFNDDTQGIKVTATFPTGGLGLDGLSTDPTVNPYLTPYFYRPAAVGNWVAINGTARTIQNVVVDDGGDVHGIEGNMAISVSGDGAKILESILNNSLRYGIGWQGAINFRIAYCTVNQAQYCLAGSGSSNGPGIVELNNVRGMTREGVKIRGCNLGQLKIRRNWIDLTPLFSGASVSGLSFSTNGPEDVDVLAKENVCIKLHPGTGEPAYGFVSQAWAQDPINEGNILENNLYLYLNKPGILSGNAAGHTGGATKDYEVRYETIFKNISSVITNLGADNYIHDNTVI